ncbi:retinaldehyde-binding protein 1-like [Pieris napi]|uniref:retinaldehyde-binding protein 1-like n=1 Tax=Pieris napi TaxID=78633 RepID=UPI001FB9588A|nr:retinaldehyde-binding protein 1-like [Pieris napi]
MQGIQPGSTMEFIPKDRILELHPDTLYQVRKEVNLEKPGEMKRAVNILKEWIKQQPHFIKKDFPDFYLETSIVGTKGSVERAKKQFDKVCTIKTLMPQFFDTYDVRKELAIDLENSIYMAMLPKLTKEHYRVIVTKVVGVFENSSTYTKYFKFCLNMAEYAKSHDYVGSFRMIADLTDCNLMDCISKINLLEIRQVMSIFMDGYGMKIKGIHFISQSKAIDALLTIFKQVLKPKIAGRMHVHKTYKDLHKIIEKDVLPSDFGGNERSMKELFDEWVDILSTDEHKEYIKHINSAGTDESLRSKDKFNEDCAGLPGTFRLLTVD